MRGRDHHAQVSPHRARQHGNSRRRHRAEQEHIHARRQKPRRQRLLDHVTRKPGVLADHHPVPVTAALIQTARRHADAQHHLGCHAAAVGGAPHPIGSEIFPRHHIFSRHWAYRKSVKCSLQPIAWLEPELQTLTTDGLSRQRPLRTRFDLVRLEVCLRMPGSACAVSGMKQIRAQAAGCCRSTATPAFRLSLQWCSRHRRRAPSYKCSTWR